MVAAFRPALTRGAAVPAPNAATPPGLGPQHASAPPRRPTRGASASASLSPPVGSARLKQPAPGPPPPSLQQAPRDVRGPTAAPVRPPPPCPSAGDISRSRGRKG